MIKVKVIKSKNSTTEFSNELNDFISNVKPEHLIKISTQFIRPFTWTAVITYVYEKQKDTTNAKGRQAVVSKIAKKKV